MRQKWHRLLAGGMVGGLLIGTQWSAASATVPAAAAHRQGASHVLLLSVDGLHDADLTWYAATHPQSALAGLVRSGVHYTDARTTTPSDSFPGMVAQLTGGGAGTAGVYYDDSFNRSLYPAGTVDCTVPTPGAEVGWTEAADRSQSPITLDAGQQLAAPALAALPTNTKQQTIAQAPAITAAILAMTPTPQALLDPAALPVSPKTCLPIYPHQYLRVNTVFEVARSHGLRTAWSDKHPAYEILNGPSGTGIQDLFTPEINSVADAAGDDWTTDNALTQIYDGTKVAAVLNEIDGFDHSGRRALGMPAIFGMNFQSVSTAEKLPVSDGLAGGYRSSGTPGPLLTRALAFVDAEVGAMVARLRAQGHGDDTAIILSAKHGQSPTNLSALRRVDDGPIIDAVNAGWSAAHPTAPPLVTFALDDDAMLWWLSDRSPAALRYAKHFLLTHSAPANRATDPKGVTSAVLKSSGLARVLIGSAAAKQFGARPGDPRRPDLFGIAQYGTVYTGKVKKIAEHGGVAPDDLNVPIVLVVPGGEQGRAVGRLVHTTQIAPTILRLLAIDPANLDAVRREHTAVLPAIGS